MPQNKLPRQIWALGFVSLLMDLSSETIHGLLPVFMVTVLGASVTKVGVLEGFADGLNFALKIVSGPLSDCFNKRKPLVLIGYSIAAISKPLFAVSNSVMQVFGARVVDRIGKGIRGAPRDALVADIAPPHLRGEAFGLRQSMDTLGAVLGPLLAMILMYLSGDNYRFVFWCATVPALLCILVIYFGVSEPTEHKQVDRKPVHISDIKQFSSGFWFVALAGAIFQLSRFSEAFLILRTKEAGLALELAPAALMVMNIVYAVTSYPVGKLSDRMRREWFLLIGLAVVFVSDLLLGLSSNLIVLFIAICFWGLHMGLTQGVLAALVVDNCPAQLRGTAFGLFNFLSAIALIAASSAAGILWDTLGSQSTFLVGAGVSAVSFILFSIYTYTHKPSAS